MVRVPSLDEAVIMKVLDAGAYGVFCPMIDTAEQAAALVSYCRYPPKGVRSFGPARGLLHGGPDYVDQADDTVIVWAMVETRTAVANIDAICATEGLDAIYIGPSDLGSDLGLQVGAYPLQPELDEAIDRIVKATKDAGLRVGSFCFNDEMAADMVKRGVDLVTVRNDAGLLRLASAHILESLARAQRP